MATAASLLQMPSQAKPSQAKQLTTHLTCHSHVADCYQPQQQAKPPGQAPEVVPDAAWIAEPVGYDMADQG